MPEICYLLQWDIDGQLLAVSCEGQGHALLYAVPTRRAARLETGLKVAIMPTVLIHIPIAWDAFAGDSSVCMQAQPLTCLAWSQTQQTLAAGTEKGSLILFNVGRRKREVLQGKHSRAVTCMAWSCTGLLAVAARDNKVMA